MWDLCKTFKIINKIMGPCFFQIQKYTLNWSNARSDCLENKIMLLFATSLTIDSKTNEHRKCYTSEMNLLLSLYWNLIIVKGSNCTDLINGVEIIFTDCFWMLFKKYLLASTFLSKKELVLPTRAGTSLVLGLCKL